MRTSRRNLPSSLRGLPLLSLFLLAACGEGGLQISGGQRSEHDAALISCAPGATVRGVDVSFYQGAIDWRAVRAAGVEFGVARVSDGTYYPDDTFQDNWVNMRAAGLVRGSYQFFRAAEDPVAQANMVVRAVGRLGAGDLPVALDVEAGSMQGVPSWLLQARINQWIEVVEAGTGKHPIVYTGKYAWDDHVASPGYGHHALWIAAYEVGCPNTPNGWGNWQFWQYSDQGRVPGIPAKVDLDVFNGTLADLQAFAGGAGGIDRNRAVQRGAFASAGQWQTGFGRPDWAGVGDFNGDGRDDLAWYEWWNGGAITVALSTGNGFSYVGPWAIGLGRPDWAGVGDFNGDGKDDIAWYETWNDGALTVLTSTGQQLAYADKWITGYGAPNWAAVGDFDGDGRSDIAWYEAWNNGAVSVIRSTGSSFSGTGPWLTGFGAPDWAAAGDVNGDGRDDLVWYEAWNEHAFTVLRSSGHDFPAAERWLAGFGAPSWAALADVNGDGRADLLWYESWNDGALTVALAENAGFTPSGKWLTGFGLPDWASAGDFTGSRRAGLAWYEHWNNGGVTLALAR